MSIDVDEVPVLGPPPAWHAGGAGGAAPSTVPQRTPAPLRPFLAALPPEAEAVGLSRVTMGSGGLTVPPP